MFLTAALLFATVRPTVVPRPAPPARPAVPKFPRPGQRVRVCNHREVTLIVSGVRTRKEVDVPDTTGATFVRFVPESLLEDTPDTQTLVRQPAAKQSRILPDDPRFAALLSPNHAPHNIDSAHQYYLSNSPPPTFEPAACLRLPDGRLVYTTTDNLIAWHSPVYHYPPDDYKRADDASWARFNEGASPISPRHTFRVEMWGFVGGGAENIDSVFPAGRQMWFVPLRRGRKPARLPVAQFADLADFPVEEATICPTEAYLCARTKVCAGADVAFVYRRHGGVNFRVDSPELTAASWRALCRVPHLPASVRHIIAGSESPFFRATGWSENGMRLRFYTTQSHTDLRAQGYYDVRHRRFHFYDFTPWSVIDRRAEDKEKKRALHGR